MAPSPAQVARALAEAVRETCERLGDEVPTVFIELGRAVLAVKTVAFWVQVFETNVLKGCSSAH